MVDGVLILSPDSRIKVLRRGQPLINARVELFLGHKSESNPLPYWSGLTSDAGSILVSGIPPASYQAFVRRGEKLMGSFTLEFPSQTESTRRISKLVVKVSPKYQSTSTSVAEEEQDLSVAVSKVPTRAWVR